MSCRRGKAIESRVTASRPRLLTAVRMAPAVLRVLWHLRRIHPRSDLNALVAAVTPRQGFLVASPERAEAAAWLARAFVRRLPRLFPQPCLYWCLAGYHFLRRAGYPAVMHFGLRRSGDALLSHAWLTVAGEPHFDDPERHGFTETLAFPRDDSACAD